MNPPEPTETTKAIVEAWKENLPTAGITDHSITKLSVLKNIRAYKAVCNEFNLCVAEPR